MSPQESQGETQTSRRWKYGLNVAIATLVALFLVVVINWIGYRHFHRFDFTATRQYSLSPQTLAVLKGIDEPYRIVTLLSQPASGTAQDQQRQMSRTRAKDMIDEYGRYCSKISVEHIDPDFDPGRLKAFYQSIVDRYAGELKPEVEAINGAHDALETLRKNSTDLQAPLGQIAANPDLPDGDLKLEVQGVAQVFARIAPQCEQTQKQVQATLDTSLPDYGGALDKLKNLLSDVSDKVFAIAIDRFTHAVEATQTPASVRKQLDAVVTTLQADRPNIDKALAALRAVKPVDNYAKLFDQLTSSSAVEDRDPIVILSPHEERVIPIGEMFHQPDKAQAKALEENGEVPDLDFQGEERITGALVSLGLKVQPMIVFTYTGRQPALGPNGEYEEVASRLRKLNFDVQEWSPRGRRGPFGQPMPAGPPPTPKPDQKAVWIIEAMDPPNPTDPSAGGDDQVIKAVQDRMAAGDSALVMVSVNSLSRFGSPDPVMQFLEPWGIHPQNDRLLLRQMEGPNHQTRNSSQFLMQDWPTDFAVTKAIAGMPGLFPQICPLLVDTAGAQKKGLEYWTLASVQGQDTWAERNLQDLQAMMTAKPDPATLGGPFIVAVAAQSKTNRLVVAGDPVWATNAVTTLGPLGPGSAEMLYAQFPANSELFVNSVYWLAGLDKLIASSARRQDIRRVGDISRNTWLTLWVCVVIGMPVLTLATGIGVWLVRRRA